MTSLIRGFSVDEAVEKELVCQQLCDSRLNLSFSIAVLKIACLPTLNLQYYELRCPHFKTMLFR